ncbi:signal transduction histidine kinase [Nonomuraea thailandensis]|uniref:histidine kinase n=1 Tax=Nonomuraea thailandensis TaxID=1188745 RepID=A0A9X2GR83_9ACTN|nr:histidine kinase [Nonomuraea thailandensis]MCP2362520.1 signal transduction histidine kinase [Nonomuraea thailandensis]
MRFVLLGAGMFAASLFVMSGQMGVPSGLPLPVQVVIAAVAGVAAWHAPRSWWPLAAVGAVTYAWLVVWPPLLVASYFAGRTLDRSRGIAAYIAACLVVCGITAVVGEARDGLQEMLTASLGNALFMALGMIGLPLAVGLWTRARAEVLEAARERAQRLEREQVMRAEQARAQERARIAREMHDVVAHRVSLIVLHAGALEVRAADEETAETAALIGGIGREALSNLRDVLGVLRAPRTETVDAGSPSRPGLGGGFQSQPDLGGGLRPQPDLGGGLRPQPGLSGDYRPRPGLGGDFRPPSALDDLDSGYRPQPTLGDLDRLLDQSRALGIAVTRHDEGEPRPVEETVERTAYRVIQEALTNVHKHAGGVPTDVMLRFGDGALEVEVRNQAPHAPPEELPGAGWGLVGLRERVELLGGSLRTSAEESGGFLVSARIPA